LVIFISTTKNYQILGPICGPSASQIFRCPALHCCRRGWLLTLFDTLWCVQTDQSGSGALPPMTSRDDVSSSEMLMWSINELSVVYAEQLRVFQNPLNRTTHNLRTYVVHCEAVVLVP